MASLAANAAKLHQALAKHDLAALKPLLTNNAILHQDNSPSLHWAKEEDRKQMDERWESVDIETSEILASAVNEDAHASFVLALFKGSKAKAEPELPAADATCIWHATWAPDDSAVQELVVFSAAHTVVKLVDEKAAPFDPALFKRPQGDNTVSAEDAAKVEAKLSAFCALYDDCNPDGVSDVLSDDFYEWRPASGRTKSGRQEVVDNLHMHGQYWKQARGAKVTAAADASSGFLAFAALGHMAGADGSFDTSTEPQLFAGLSFVLLGADGNVSRSVHLDISEAKITPLRWTGFI